MLWGGKVVQCCDEGESQEIFDEVDRGLRYGQQYRERHEDHLLANLIDDQAAQACTTLPKGFMVAMTLPQPVPEIQLVLDEGVHERLVHNRREACENEICDQLRIVLVEKVR